jgi:hypothetical protein
MPTLSSLPGRDRTEVQVSVARGKVEHVSPSLSLSSLPMRDSPEVQASIARGKVEHSLTLSLSRLYLGVTVLKSRLV